MVNSGLMSSKRDEYETPQQFFNKLHAEFNFILDAAASADNAKCELFYTVEDDALSKHWLTTTWCNPPYGRKIGSFVRKAFSEAVKWNATIVMLIPARTDTSYWHDCVMHAREVRLVRRRLRFLLDGVECGPAPFPSAIVVFDGEIHEGHRTPTFSSMEAT